MSREIPEPVRAAAGLAATVLDEARRLPETLPGLPVRVIGLAMQVSMKVQQQYAGLVARGDELLTGVRGEDEPGLATFDDDVVDLPAATGVGTSSFDRVAETIIEVTEDDEADAVVNEALDELALEELVEAVATDTGSDADGLPESAVLETSPVPGADAPVVDEPAPGEPGGSAAGTPDIGTSVDVVTPDGDVATVEAAITDEGVAAVEGAATATDDSGTSVAAATPVTAPVEGYDDWSVAQLRGRLRGYQLATVADLVSYEEANRAREPYLRMLRNRLEKVEQQAVEASPLAPRGI